MVLLPHSAFIGLEGFYIIESVKYRMTIIMYHSKMLKYDDSNKKLYTVFVNIMCMQACDIFLELSDQTNGKISKFTYYSIIWCMFYIKCHTIREGRLTICPR